MGREEDVDGSISVIDEDFMLERTLFARKKIEVAAMFVAAEKDWGPHQYPGGLEAMNNAYTKRETRVLCLFVMLSIGYSRKTQGPP